MQQQQTPEKALYSFIRAHRVDGEQMMRHIIEYGNSKIIGYAIDAGYLTDADEAYRIATLSGNIGAIEVLYARGCHITTEIRSYMVECAEHTAVTAWLLANPDKN